MQYQDLSPSDRAALDAFMAAYRPTMGQVSRMLKQMQTIVDAADASITSILGQLDAEAIISDPTGLAGAQPLPKEQILSDMDGFRAVITGYDTPQKRQERIKAAGINV